MDNRFDHPIFLESINLIQKRLGDTGLAQLQQKVLERLIHSSGDFDIKPLLQFTPNACELGIEALKSGAPILTDTQMAASAVIPMAKRTLQPLVFNALEWCPISVELGSTRTAIGIERAWRDLSPKFSGNSAPIVLIGSAPKALQVLLELVIKGFPPPSLIIGMPVGFIGVSESKKLLATSGIPHIRLDGSRGGAALVAATINALLRSSIEGN